jgi:hypothetical protein
MGFISELSFKVAVGVISSVIIAALTYVCRTSILNRILSVTYNGLNVAGTWSQKQKFMETGEDIEYETRLILKQVAHNLTGSWVFIKNADGKKAAESTMRVTGELLEGFVALNLRSSSNKQLSLGSMLLKVHDGELASGHYIFRNTHPNFPAEIGTLPMKLVREKYAA